MAKHSQLPAFIRRRIPDPQIQGIADQYHDAFCVLVKHMPGGVAPLLNAGSIAAELYLKSLSARTVHRRVETPNGVFRVTPTPQKVHCLGHLFEAIPADIRAQVERAFEAESGPSAGSLRASLGHFERAFEASRYPFDIDLDITRYPLGRLQHLCAFLRTFVAGLHVTERIDTGGPFTRGELELANFEGFLTVTELRDAGASKVPRGPGVYVVLREESAPPAFLARNPGGRHKGREPTIDVAVLKKNWTAHAPTLYIGKAADLRRRLRLLLEFGAGKPVSHHGGRSLWQVEGAARFVIAWKSQAQGQYRQTEQVLLRQFKKLFGKRPFANLTG